MIDRAVTITILSSIIAWNSVQSSSLNPARQQELKNTVQHDCGACHGLTLKGGLGPPLTQTALSQKSTEALVQTILHGRPGTAMPPWKFMLSQAEADWIVSNLKQGRFSHNIATKQEAGE